ncbi:hypothetical protein P170DRAFT_447214 [Aspergillus steynii IBT 23096]|uniref:Clr5 domain-containing protein n=1 Tax=Aspergillus steynii IBT 23096 TaxID=1392250 RepID=A0A2I2G9K6_9EURO|nr:uncharacterized protein P170DRAFT_447214 [Aspergillus steynii IBT 23096]PLB49569.1 hypothetical protein P170DRAFT_447214 [Aspergillus steynii IBT 23096]
MKNSIPSDVWERKKSMIAQLYKDEEWPLKQVIKKIRSDDFNPSETQLRSRLKKWRVTKPSRQTRKKSQDDQQEASGNDGSQRDQSSSVSPKTKLRPMHQSTATDVEPEWLIGNGVYSRHGGPPATASFDGRSSTSSPSVAVLSGSHAYDPSHTSPLVDGVLLDSSAMASPFHESSYAVTTDGMQPPVSTTAPVQWSIPQWYSMALEAGTQHPSMPFFNTAPLSPPIDHALQMMPQHPHGVYAPQSPRSSSFSTHHMPNYHEDAKSWQRAVSVPYISDAAGGHPKLDPKGRQHTPLEGKPSLSSKASSQPPVGLMTPPSPFYSNGQHPVMCAPMYHYPGPEPLVHKPSSIDF